MRAPELWQVALCLSQQRMSITIPSSSQSPTSPRWGVPAAPKAFGTFLYLPRCAAAASNDILLYDTFGYLCSTTWKSFLFQALELFELLWALYAAAWEQEHIPAWTSKLLTLDWRDWEMVWGNWGGGSYVSWAGLAARPQHLCPSPQPQGCLGFWDTTTSPSAHPARIHQPHNKRIIKWSTVLLWMAFFFFSFHQEITKLPRSDSWGEILVKSGMLRAPLLLLDMFVSTTGAP